MNTTTNKKKRMLQIKVMLQIKKNTVPNKKLDAANNWNATNKKKCCYKDKGNTQKNKKMLKNKKPWKWIIGYKILKSTQSDIEH